MLCPPCVQVARLWNVTHGYAFWPGWAFGDQCHVGRVFVASGMLGMAVVGEPWADPVAEMRLRGFGDLLCTWQEAGMAMGGACCTKGVRHCSLQHAWCLHP